MSNTVGAALADATSTLRWAAGDTPRLDAELLLGHVLERDRSWLLAHPEASLDAGAAASFRALVTRRARGEPVAYLRGYKEWHSLRIRTDARALIPRPETEVLADAAMREIAHRLERRAANDGPMVAWEVATGSGAVAVALCLRFADAVRAGRLTLIASDISTDALALAADNLNAHGLSDLVPLVEADLLGPAGSGLPRPDVVIANLPYLSTAEADAAGGSLAHEPRMAVEGGPDGTELLRRFFDELPTHAAPDATVLLETAFGQAPTVVSLAPARATSELIPDLAGIDRVVVVRLAA